VTERDRIRLRAAHRRRFLEAVRAVAPDVLADLAGEPLGAYRAALAAGELDPIRRSVAEALDTWAASYHLDADWIRAEAIETLATWARDPAAPANPAWTFRPLDDWGGVPVAVEFDDRVDVAEEGAVLSPAALRARVRAEIEEQLEPQLDHYAELRREAAGPSVPRGDVTAPETFEGLARRQVLDVPWNRIADDASEDRRRVVERVRGLARYLGLALRPSRPAGRPRGARTRRPRDPK
jgi:hypothetical protein